MLKKPILFLLLFSIHAAAQVKQRDILANKYSSSDIANHLIDRSDWKPYPKTVAEWEKALPDSLKRSVIKAGEAALAKEMPSLTGTIMMNFARSGDREEHGAISFGRRSNLTDLVLAEAVEGKNRFTEAIFNYVWLICEESFWGVSAHLSMQKAGKGLPDAADPTVDLFAAETASVLALTDYFVGDKLDAISPFLRQRIRYETNLRVFEPIKKTERYGYLSRNRPVNNWNPWIVSNLLTANLLLQEDTNLRKENAYTYLTLMDAYLNSLGDDGGCDEGPSYWFAAGACVFDVLEMMQSATNNKVDIFDNQLIHNLATYVYKVHIANDYFVNFADADPKLRPDGLMLYRFGQKIKDEQLTQFGIWAYNHFPATGSSNNGFHRMRKVQNLLTVNKIPSTESTFSPVSYAWLSDIEVMTARSKNGLYLATHGGHNAESHNHNDVGDFIIYADGEPIIIDAGRGNYTARTFSAQRYELWFTQSQYHNLPIINGYGQKAGRAFMAETVSSNNTEKEATLKMDIAKSYPKEAGIKTWNRSVTMDRNKNSVTIAEQYTLDETPKTLEQIFMTVCEVDHSKVGKIIFTTPTQKTVTLNYDAKKWTVSTELPSTDGMEYRSFKTKWDNHPVQRIVLKDKQLKKASNFNFVIQK